MPALPALALALEGVWIASLGLRPWRAHPGGFLAVFAAAFFLYLPAVRRTLQRPQSLGLILAAGVLFRLTAFLSPPSLSDDIYRYLWDGRVQAAGHNPYRFAPDAPELASLRNAEHTGINHKSVPTIYPPLAQAVFRLAVALSPTLAAQRVAFLLFDLALLFLLPSFLRARGLPPERCLVYAWHPLAVAEFASSGHLDSLGLFFLFAGLLAFHRRKFVQAGVFSALSFLGKLGSAVLLPWLLFRREGRRTAVFMALGIGAGYAFYLTPPLTETFASLFAGTRTYARDWSFNAGIYAALSAATGAPGRWLRLGVGLLWTVAALGLARRFKDPLAYAAGAVALALALSPVVHPWYALWLLPFLCFFPHPAGLAFTGLVALSYLVLAVYDRTGRWALPPWVPIVEYGTTYGLWFFALRRRPARILGNSAPDFPVRPAIVIPAFNEEKAIGAVLGEIPRDRTPQIIVVDNGSTDGTADAARSRGASVVAEPRRGYGRAVQAGARALSSDRNVLVILDGDHSDFPEDLPSLLGPLERNEADLVIGSRVLGGAPRDSLTPQQRFGNWLSCRLLALLFGQSFTDLGPFRALRRDLFDRLGLTDPTYGWNVEMQIKALRAGARVREVPVRYRRRIGVSKISGTVKGTVLAGIKILWTIAREAGTPAPDSPEKW